MEEWKTIKGYEGSYEVSSLGRVRSLSRVVASGNQSKNFELLLHGRLLKPQTDRTGYHRVCLGPIRDRKGFAIHRLVATAFLENKNNKPEVNHLDGDKKNNNVGNLEWCTSRENHKHARETGLRERFYPRKNTLKVPDARRIKLALKCGIKQSELCRIYGVDRGVISKIKRGVTWNWV